jgi:hypothetical protein
LFFLVFVVLVLIYVIGLSLWDMRRPGKRLKLLIRIALLGFALAVVIWLMIPRHAEVSASVISMSFPRAVASGSPTAGQL